MRKTGYRFNPETLSYDKIEITWRKKLWVFTKKLFSTLSLAVIIFFIFDRGKYKHIVLIIKANLSFFSYENFFLKVLLFMADTIIYYKKERNGL